MDCTPPTRRSANILPIILAGGRGSRLHDLTDAESKPALPVGERARLIDFTLANVANSGFDRAMLLTQYAPDGLHRHVADAWNGAGRLAIDILGGRDHGMFEGTADAVAKVIPAIDRAAPEHVVVLAGDHLYQMDYAPFVERHVAMGADVTVGVVHVPVEEASGFGVMSVDARSRITAFVEKPANPATSGDKPGHAQASMGIYVFRWSVLKPLLERMALAHDELDFGKHIIPYFVRKGSARAFALTGRAGRAPLWRDLGTLDAYHQVHQELSTGELALDPAWPATATAAPAASRSSAMLRDCSIGAGAMVGAGSRLRNVVVLPGARIGRSVRIEDAIVAGDVVIPDGFHLDHAIEATRSWCTTSENGIRLISRASLDRLAEALRAEMRDATARRANDNGASCGAWIGGIAPALAAAPAN